MNACCTPGDVDDVFSPKQAESDARRYRRKGLDGEARRIAAVVGELGVQDRAILEVGGGIGDLVIELLRHGASRATNVELSRSYEPFAMALLREAGLEGRVERRVADFVAEAHAVPAADVVILQRVVCCYPDADALVRASARHAKRALVLTFLVDRPYTRFAIGLANLALRLRGSKFRSFVHPTRAVIAAAEAEGLRLQSRNAGFVWQMLVLERDEAAA